tara:strand:- start:1455 stop:1943 length:489 start_codon:yes stop_codon:yes gene_type:complete
MSHRTFSIVSPTATVAGSQSLIVIRPPVDGVNLEVIEARISQNGTTTAEQVRCAIGLKSSAYQTVTAGTPVAMRQGGTASVITGGTAVAAGTSGVNASAEGGGTFVPLVEDGFSNVNGWVWLPMPDSRIVIPSGSADALTLKLASTPTGLTGWSAVLIFREL